MRQFDRVRQREKKITGLGITLGSRHMLEGQGWAQNKG